MEALLRWQHPTLGLLYPLTFIPLAEETGIIIKMGEWILKTACSQMKIWQDTINSNISIAVNISPFQFQQKNFFDILQNILKETGLHPSFLELEITESLLFKNVTEISDKMFKLKELGIRLALDDFGTGYASFNYLRNFPFDKIKIDKNFIETIHSNTIDSFIVETIINMANKMGVTVLAEGVETPEQVEFLISHHGDQMQGYYFSPPLPEEGCTELLKNQQFFDHALIGR
jgi:EAL domain-containing protein (putative c-di-GMP-specific phosphodiesterase class I)